MTTRAHGIVRCRVSRALLLLLAVVCVPVPPAAALGVAGPSSQQDPGRRLVRGAVVLEDTGEPVTGALVVLRAQGDVLARTLTNASGEFTLRADAARDEAEITAEVIGRASARVRLAPGDTTAVLFVRQALLDLSALGSGPVPACTSSLSPDRDAGLLWTEIRKALAIDVWGRESQLFLYDVFQFERQLDTRGRIAGERGRRIRDLAGSPARSRSPAEVEREGYALRSEGGDVLYSPDAEILLSASFAATHCFRVRGGDRARVGLAFETTGARSVVDIEGVFWVDRATARLTTVEFAYTGLGVDGPQRPGGMLEYVRTSGGVWTLARWSVRTPVPGAGQRIREQGVEVIHVMLADGRALPVVPRAALIGTLTDRVGGQPVAGAAVRLIGTDYGATTNEDGRFFIPELPGGRFLLAATAPTGEVRPGVPTDVWLMPDRATHVTITLEAPAAAEPPPVQPRFTALDSIRFYLRELGITTTAYVDSLILDGLRDDRFGTLVGRITDAGSGRPIGGVLVRVTSTDRSTVTENNGTFAFRDVPVGRHVLSAEMLGYAPRTDTVRVIPGEIIEATFGMTTQPIALAPIDVVVRSRWLHSQGFYERRLTGLAGHFFTRADIEQKAPGVFTDLLRNLPGVLVLSRGVGASSVYFRRVTTISSDEGARGCEPAIYYDGIPMNQGWDRLHEIPIPFIEGIEVYVGAATPIQYTHPCGVVLIWTRRPR